MKNAVDLDAAYCNTGKRAEKHTAQRVAERRAVAALQRFDNESSLTAVFADANHTDIGLFNFYHFVPSLKSNDAIVLSCPVRGWEFALHIYARPKRRSDAYIHRRRYYLE